MKFCSFLIFTFILGFAAHAQHAPLPNTPATVGLWNFDTDDGDTVYDTSADPIAALAYNTTLEAMPNAPVSFGLARRFSQENSFVDIGVVSGSKFDFTNANEVSVQALIQLTAPANGIHFIFSTDNFRLLVINNQLAVAVRQPGGIYGVVSERILQQDTVYRVGAHYLNQELVISIDGRYDSRATLEHPIAAPLTSNFRGTIGGNILGEYFPGYIDDVRMKNIADFDMRAPEISMVEPNTPQVNIPRPHFRFALSDLGSGIDDESVVVSLNGVAQTGLTISASEVSGQLNTDLSAGALNEVTVSAADLVGNVTTKSFFILFQQLEGRGEYTTDSATLALWHMNDFASGVMEDSSGRGHDGIGNSLFVNVGEGVFSKGKVFVGNINSFINFDGVRFDQKFTVEGWFNPNANHSSDEVLFYNGQVTIVRHGGGYIRVVFHTTNGSIVYGSPQVLLPVGELHHLAVSWDGTKKTDNLLFFVDGALLNLVTAVSQCDFDPTPKIGVLGQYFSGMIDEMRISSSNRISFSIPTIGSHGINYLTLQNGTSTNEDYPELQAVFNTGSEVNVSTVKVRLNGVEQTGPGLIVSEASVMGVFSQPIQTGLNTVEIEYYDNDENFKKKSQHFFGIKKLGLAEYTPDEFTAGLWHFNDGLADSSGNGAHFSGTRSAVAGVLGQGQNHPVSLTNLNLSCRSFTLEGHLKFNSFSVGNQNLVNLYGGNFSSSMSLNSTNGNMHIYMSANGAILDVVVNAAIPLDTAYHHIAVVFDHTRPYSQLLLVVDGVVKMARDYRISCDQGTGYTFNLGGGNYFSLDEFRFSRKAQYEFNLQKPGTDRPEITGFSHADQSTTELSEIEYQIIVEDAEGIDLTRSKLLLNGQPITMSSSLNKGRFVTTLTSTLPLNVGANEIRISIIDLNGNEVLASSTIYRSNGVTSKNDISKKTSKVL